MFKRVYIEISNICNLQCTFCPVVERDKQVLNPVHFESVLKQVKPLAEEVCLHLMGEPLTHPKFKEVLAICDQYETPVQLTSNGVVIESKEDILLGFKSLRQINFSLQSFKDNFPNRSFRDYMETIFSFSKKLLEQRPETYINYRIWNIGRGDQGESENEEIFSLIEESFDLEINRQIQVESIKSKRLTGRLYLHFDSHFDWPSLQLPFQGESGRCHALSSHFGIHADGTVVPCCLDKEAANPLGNCLEESLSSILNNKRSRAIKEGFQRKERVEKLCQHCTYINRF